MTIKLSQLIPQDESYSVPDKDGNEHEFKMFVPFALSLAQSEIIERKEGEKPNESQLQLVALESLLKPQHGFMDQDWIAENISLPHQNFIYAVMIKKVNEGAQAIITDTTRGKKGKKKLFSH